MFPSTKTLAFARENLFAAVGSDHSVLTEREEGPP